MPIALNNLISTRSILTLLSPQAGTKGLSRSFHTPIRNYEIELYRIGHGSSRKINKSHGHPRYTVYRILDVLWFKVVATMVWYVCGD